MNENAEGVDNGTPEGKEGVELCLDPVETRVLACLVEKEIATPEYYPLTLKALTAACNQKSNRSPVMSLTEETVTDSLDVLRYDHHLVWHVDAAASRTPKYRHRLRDLLGTDPHALVVMCELMLRGPQTQAELRAHGSRLAAFESLAQVQDVIARLENWDGRPMLKKLPPGPGRREPRYAHLLCGDEGLPESAAETTEANEGAAPEARVSSREARTRALEEQVSALREELDSLREHFDAFRGQFE